MSGSGYDKSIVSAIDLRAGHPCPAPAGCFSTACQCRRARAHRRLCLRTQRLPVLSGRPRDRRGRARGAGGIVARLPGGPGIGPAGTLPARTAGVLHHAHPGACRDPGRGRRGVWRAHQHHRSQPAAGAARPLSRQPDALSGLGPGDGYPGRMRAAGPGASWHCPVRCPPQRAAGREGLCAPPRRALRGWPARVPVRGRPAGGAAGASAACAGASWHRTDESRRGSGSRRHWCPCA